MAVCECEARGAGLFEGGGAVAQRLKIRVTTRKVVGSAPRRSLNKKVAETSEQSGVCVAVLL